MEQVSRCANEASAASELHSRSAAANKMSWKGCYEDNNETTRELYYGKCDKVQTLFTSRS